MMGKTHMMIGAAAGAFVEAHAPGIGVIEGFAVGALGGLLPDLDHPNSMLTHKVAPITIGSRKISLALTALGVLYLGYKGWFPLASMVVIAIWVLIAAFAKHRGITHSLIGIALATYAFHGWLGSLWLAFAAAYASHLLADALTHGGVPLLWPYHKDFHLLTGLSTGHFLTNLVEGLIQAVAFVYMGLLIWDHAQDLFAIVHNGILKFI